MIPQEKIQLPSIQQLKILVECEKVIVYKDQKVYKVNGSFKRAMEKMIKAHWFEKKKKSGSHSHNEYTLTFDGKIIKAIMKDFNESNKSL